ncbi:MULTISPECIES: TcpQ domain-containing protein [Xanthomonas]|uniref:TcpQ domain-containing protein n=1 Tax=Xanthomonas TaxID=338 RepID=UPI0004A241AB|nr:TcpQ domain-containing protein [Xanthomonas euvesicatoria]MBV6872022.1 toxin co-regulated pilus biosynthesis Q family protein [Xanthomonas campestris pv. veroniae]MBV6889507.1 toxin co-regulated pilus biosynthesis Q family protein [Xanthomonas campestris pv. spermacoces]MCP3034389.1 toxin co-regulated pilus biosynthesis Q family protein [Xanthomonas euvesicatoria pv. allii]PPU86537.1 hypothetical protein XaclCFBP3371_21070 [Xanthomonas euvesicatoria pv. citrumelonis]QTK46153.1 hypothetical 
MKQVHLLKISAVFFAVFALSSCATKPAADFGGRWRPVNRFAETPMELPLHSSYVYQATPMDGTLKTMLERWAKDSNMTLAYNITSDYTLYSAVAKVDTTSIKQAVEELSAVYAMQGVSVSVVGNQIIVQPASKSAG